MNVGSLFSGIGGLDEGLRRAGMRHVFFCESDSYRRDVLRARFPGTPVYEDVVRLGEPEGGGSVDGLRTATDKRGREAGAGLPDDLDLLCGGFPCQDLSVAGRRAGLAGERSGLFHEFARVADALRPGWLLVENVPGLLSSQGGRDFGVVLGTLADLGYGVAWRILDSRFFGVPQRRRRVFIVGALADGDPRAAAERAGAVLAVGEGCTRHSKARGEAGAESAVASLSGPGSGGPDDNDGQGGRLVAHSSVTGEGHHQPKVFNWQTGGDMRLGYGDLPTALQKEQTPAVHLVGGVRRLTPRECERLQGLPDDWTQLGDTPDSRRYAALGDAVTVNVAEWIGRRLRQAA